MLDSGTGPTGQTQSAAQLCQEAEEVLLQGVLSMNHLATFDQKGNYSMGRGVGKLPRYSR